MRKPIVDLSFETKAQYLKWLSLNINYWRTQQNGLFIEVKKSIFDKKNLFYIVHGPLATYKCKVRCIV